MRKHSLAKRVMSVCAAFAMTAAMLAGAVSVSASDDAAKDSLKVALTEEPDYLSTCDHDSLMGVQMNLLTYNGLIRIDMETLAPVCDLAESYTQDSDTEWTFKLKEGVKFHNGDDFTAADVVASIENAKSYDASATYTSGMDTVEAVDDYTVKITTNGPQPNLLYDLAYHYNFILPKSLIESGNDFSANPVGTGPWKFVEWNKGNDILFEANEDYFDADRTASIKSLDFVIIPEGSTRDMALESGQVDFVYSVDSADIERLQNTDGIAVEQIVSVENFFLYLNCVTTAFEDTNLRLAVAYALNRDDIVAGALNGYGTPSYSTVSMGYPESTDENAYSYDIDKAKEYLEAWGGDPSSVTLDIICSNSTKVAIATIIQAYLSQIGITVTINEMDGASYQAAMMATDLDSAIVSWSPANAMTYVNRFNSERRSQTPACWISDKLDEMTSEMRVNMDEESRSQQITDIIAEANAECVFVPLYQVNYFRGHNADLQNVVCSATGYVDFCTMSWS